MGSLSGLAVLVVEDDEDTRELLEVFLEGEGARVLSADSASAARAQLAQGGVDVILTDAQLPDEDGFVFVAGLRADPLTRAVPAILVTGYSDARSRKRALEGGFQKFITKPFDVFTLPAAIASVVGARQGVVPRGETDAQRDARLVERRDVRALLANLNEPTPYRYTSLLRLDADTLDSVWTFDRQDQASDRFSGDMPLSASYCGLVRATGAPLVITDASTDPRVADHPKRSVLLSYCGIPLWRTDGSIYGTLCHYDAEPRAVDESVILAMSALAERLVPVLPLAAGLPPAND